MKTIRLLSKWIKAKAFGVFKDFFAEELKEFSHCFIFKGNVKNVIFLDRREITKEGNTKYTILPYTCRD